MSLSTLLNQQLQIMQNLNDLLEEEREIITKKGFDPEAVYKIALRKQSLIQIADDSDKIRKRALVHIGYQDTRDGSHQAAVDAGCVELWDSIMEIVSRVRHLNELNGSVINIHMNNNQKMLDFQAKAAGGVMYGPDGKSNLKVKGSGTVSTRA